MIEYIVFLTPSILIYRLLIVYIFYKMLSYRQIFIYKNILLIIIWFNEVNTYSDNFNCIRKYNL